MLGGLIRDIQLREQVEYSRDFRCDGYNLIFNIGGYSCNYKLQVLGHHILST